MEQRISVAQLNELNDEQKERLREWWEPKEFDLAVVNKEIRICIDDGEYTIFHFASKEFCKDWNGGEFGPAYPLLSIGQCIELIESKTNKMGLQFYNTTCDWHVWLGNYGGRMKRDWLEDELITTLWQAVKTIL